jgi:hypothetical protein
VQTHQAVCGSVPAGSARSLSRAADLACLHQWLEEEQSWPEGARSEARSLVDTLAKDAAELSAPSFFLRVAEIAALADNGHSNLSAGVVYRQFGLLPIRTSWFDDGLFVTRVAPTQRRLLGTRVVELAGRSPAQLLTAMSRYHGGTAERFWAYVHVPYFLSPSLLHAAGLTANPDRVPLVLEESV